LSPNGSRRPRFGHAFRALQHRNYRLFFAGQAISLVGTWISRIAIDIGAPRTVIVGGSLCIVGAALFARLLPRLRTLVRPIYEAYGIPPPLPEGVGSTAGLVPPAERPDT